MSEFDETAHEESHTMERMSRNLMKTLSDSIQLDHEAHFGMGPEAVRSQSKPEMMFFPWTINKI